MSETNVTIKVEAEYKKAQIGPKSVAPALQTSSETGLSRAVYVPENGKVALVRFVPRTPRPTASQSRTD